MDVVLCGKNEQTYTAEKFSELATDVRANLKTSLICIGCGDVAWFRSATRPDAKVKRAAHFNSHHHNGECEFRTSYFLVEDESDGSTETPNAIPLVTEYGINLDTQKGGKLDYDPLPQLPDEGFDVAPSGGAVGRGGAISRESSASRSLRQILSYLKRFPEFQRSEKTVTLYSTTNRIKVQDTIRNLVVHFDDVTPEMEDDRERLFWGVIVDAKDEYTDNGLWLNASDSRKGLSIKIFRDIKQQFLDSFHVSDYEELDGAHVLVAGKVRYSQSTKKPVVFCAFSTFITVKKYRETKLLREEGF
ncbi:hypothetical protein NDN17_17240 [Shewanella algae]|uniref:hypothetical protein n=1 Tax=Shewanella algae TaxID=38313 RepID=UPI0020362EA4|nr:hypothetical protein [Shewanella algae]MCM2530247.1 hypothetical protein [Shewanella algae]